MMATTIHPLPQHFHLKYLIQVQTPPSKTQTPVTSIVRRGTPDPLFGQIKRTVRESQTLAPLRVKGVEDGDLGIELVGDVVPLVIWAPADLRDLMDGNEVFLGVELSHREVTAWAGEVFSDARVG
jgi:hypothetical protein